MPTKIDITFDGEDLVLNADRTLWWPRQRTLFATDLHAGKTEHMRMHGLAIPGGVLQADLARLQTAAKRHNAQRLIFLGDLFHSEYNSEWETFAAWSRSRNYRVDLVRGNHDRFLSDSQLQAADLDIYGEPFKLEPFNLRHHPGSTFVDNEYVLAGHLHPVVWTQGSGKDRLRSPCFVVRDRQIILPAFGSFTGGLTMRRAPDTTLYACAGDDTAIIKI